MELRKRISELLTVCMLVSSVNLTSFAEVSPEEFSDVFSEEEIMVATGSEAEPEEQEEAEESEESGDFDTCEEEEEAGDSEEGEEDGGTAGRLFMLSGMAATPSEAKASLTGAQGGGIICYIDVNKDGEIDDDDAEFTAVQDAVDAAENGQIIRMIGDSAENITVGNTKDIKLDLNGCVLKSGTDGSSVIKIEAGVKLSIEDGDSDKTHEGVYESLPSGGCITGGDSTNGGGIYVAAGAELTMTGGTICGNKAAAGGGIYVAVGEIDENYYKGKASLEDVKISDNSAADGGGMFLDAVMVNTDVGKSETYAAQAELTGCTVEENKATGSGGGVFLNGGQILMTGCTVRKNTADVNGGGICEAIDSDNDAAADASFKCGLFNTEVKENTAGEHGGGAYIEYYFKPGCFAEGTPVTMADGTVKAIEDIAEGDLVRTFDHESGRISSAKVYLTYEGETQAVPFTLTFDNGRRLSIAACHDLLEQNTLKYVTIREENAESYIGKSFYGEDGQWHELLGVTKETEACRYYSICTAEHQNCFANGFLSVTDDTDFLLNLYELDESLKADAEQLEADIAEYGLMSFEYAREKTGMSRDYYEACGAGYLFIAYGKGLCTEEGTLAIYNEANASKNAAAVPAKEEHPVLSALGSVLRSVRSLFMIEAYAETLSSAAPPSFDDIDAGGLTVGSGTAVTGNTAKAGNENVYLTRPGEGTTDALIHFYGNSAERSDISVGVTACPEPTEEKPVQITDTAALTDEEKGFLFSDKTDYTVGYNADKSYLELKIACAAQIVETEKKYATVQKAVDAAGEGETVQLIRDAAESITIASCDNIKLDLNGHVLSAPDGERIILNQGVLTITDSQAGVAHYFKYRKNSPWELDPSASEGIEVSAITSETADGTVVKVSGGILYGGNATDNGGAVSMQKDSTAVTTTFTGGSVVGCQAKCGGAVFLNEGKLILNGGNIYGCRASESGGGVESFANEGKASAVSFSAGSIMYCSAPIGGAIYNKEYSELKLSGAAAIACCTASNIGGGVCTNGTFEMTAGSIQGCEADKGGGVFVNSQKTASFTMTGGSVTDNHAATRSGGVEVKGSLILGGTASVSENTLGSGADAAASNIYLNGTGKTMNVKGGFEGSAGVSTSVLPTAENPVAISGANSDDYSNIITSDSAGHMVRYNTSKCLELVKASYSISYTLNGGSWESGYTAPGSYNSNTGVTLPAAGEVSRTGYSFAGWYDNGTFSGSAVTAVSTGETGNKTFYAKWEHVHASWNYSADGAVLTAKCGNPGCTLEESKVSVTVKAEGAVYDRIAYDGASVENTSAWEAAGLTAPEILYHDAKGSLLSGAPKNAGVYTAEITAGSVVAEEEFTISPASLTVSGTAAESKIYDGTDRADVTAGSLSGVISGDTVTVSAEGTFDSKDAGTGKPVSVTYVLGGADAGNYAADGTTASADITKRIVSVKADDLQSRIGEALIPLTYTADALCAGDSFTGSLTTDADKDTAGSYDILQGTLDAGDNYTVAFTKGIYEIAEKEPDVPKKPEPAAPAVQEEQEETVLKLKTTGTGTGTPELPATGTWVTNADGSRSFGNDGNSKFTKTWAYIADSSQTGADWYYFGEDGKAKTGFQTIDGKTYYFRETKDSRECAMETGWQNIGGKMYHFNDSNGAGAGAMNTGWLLDDNRAWYYLEKDKGKTKETGAMKTGWMTDPDDGFTYYLDPKTGKMVTGKAVIDGKEHYFNETVLSASGWYRSADDDWEYTDMGIVPYGAETR